MLAIVGSVPVAIATRRVPTHLLPDPRELGVHVGGRLPRGEHGGEGQTLAKVAHPTAGTDVDELLLQHAHKPGGEERECVYVRE